MCGVTRIRVKGLDVVYQFQIVMAKKEWCNEGEGFVLFCYSYSTCAVR